MDAGVVGQGDIARGGEAGLANAALGHIWAGDLGVVVFAGAHAGSGRAIVGEVWEGGDGVVSLC